MSVKHDAVDQRAVYPGPIATQPGLGRVWQELEQWCEHGDVEIQQRVREKVMAHGVAHSPVPVNTVSSNKPGIACATARTVLSQQVLLNNKLSQGSEQTTVSLSTPCPYLCSHHIGCTSNNFQFPSPLSALLCSATPSLLFTKQTPLGEVVKLFVQKSYRQKRPFFSSLALSRRPPVGLHAAVNTLLDKRDKTP